MVGTADGKLGDEVGFCVAKVGGEGDAEGLEVGLLVGVVGLADGDADGDELGILVGLELGDADGDVLGDIDGLTDGDVDGFPMHASKVSALIQPSGHALHVAVAASFAKNPAVQKSHVS